MSGDGTGAARVPPRGARAAARLSLLLIGLLLAAIAGRSWRPPRVPLRAAGLPQEAEVARIDDGDSVVLRGGERLRYTGIDAPERGEPGAEEARARNRVLVEGRRVRLEADRETRDRHGRLLAYVRLADGTLVNERLVQEGWARAVEVPPNTRMSARLAAAEEEARRAGRGIWAGRPVPLVASRRGRVYHLQGCPAAGRIQREDLRHIEGRAAAARAGLRPCRRCRP